MIPLADFEKAISGKTVLIDTNIIIYLTDSVSPYAALSRRLFEMIEFGEASALISIISVGEVMQGPLKKGLEQAALAPAHDEPVRAVENRVHGRVAAAHRGHAGRVAGQRLGNKAGGIGKGHQGVLG